MDGRINGLVRVNPTRKTYPPGRVIFLVCDYKVFSDHHIINHQAIILISLGSRADSGLFDALKNRDCWHCNHSITAHADGFGLLLRT